MYNKLRSNNSNNIFLKQTKIMKNGETTDSVISIDKMQNISWRRRKDARPPEIIEAAKKNIGR